MTWAERSAAALRQLALDVLDDATSTQADIAAAESYLASEQNLDRLSLAEVDCYIDITGRALDQQVSDEHATAHELASSWQHVADERRLELDRTETPGVRLPNPRCKRCAEFDDDDLQVLREACAEETAEGRILDGAKLALPEVDHHGQ
jgi:hypothetical protein